MSLAPAQRETLLTLARASIEHGLRHDGALALQLGSWPEPLRRPRASFVTLRADTRLRGCIGALEATRPLARDVAMNAFAAAFRDPRFEPVSGGECAGLEIRIAVLSAIEPLAACSEAELLRQLRPGVDGLIVEEEARSATFLPAVWRSLPNAVDFVTQLKLKAGFEADYWSPGLRACRYTTEEF